MGGVLFQYGTAAHLALLTAAPLVLQTVCGPHAQAMVLAWISVFAAIWVLMNPAAQRGEWPRDARRRIGVEILHDPFSLFALVALVVSAVRALNGGVALAYVPSSGLWELKSPFVSLLPGSVTGAGVLPLAGVFALSVVVLGVRHALGLRGRVIYLLLSAALAAGSVVFWKLRAAGGVDPLSFGTILGIYFLMGVAAWTELWKIDRVVLELVAGFSVAALLFGMLAYAPTFPLEVFALAGVLLLGLGFCFSVLHRPTSAWFQSVLALVIVLAPIALLVLGELSRPALWPLFTQDFLNMRTAATSAALSAWSESTQLGVGIGAFPLALGFHAKPEDWQVLVPGLAAAPNGWVHYLFERGILGVVVFLTGLGLLLWDGISRYLRAGSGWMLSTLHFLGPLALLAVAAVLFVDCTYVQFQAMMPVAGALALTTASLPSTLEAEDHG